MRANSSRRDCIPSRVAPCSASSDPTRSWLAKVNASGLLTTIGVSIASVKADEANDNDLDLEAGDDDPASSLKAESVDDDAGA